MKTILTVLLALISTSVFGQGVSVRSNNGRATNLTAYGNVTLGGNLINTWDDVTNFFTQTGTGGSGVTNNQYLPGLPIANGASFTNLNATNLTAGIVSPERAGSISNHTDVSAGAFVSGGYFGWDAVTGTFTNGLPAAGAGGGGSATNLTPWTSDIDGGGFSLSNASLTGPLLIWNTSAKTNGSYSDATGQIYSNAVGSVKLAGSKVYMGTNLNGTINTTNVLQVDTQAGNALNVDTNRGVTMKGGLAVGTSIAGAAGTITISGAFNSGSGGTFGSSVTSGGTLTAAGGNYLSISGMSRMYSPADGQWNMSANNGLSFNVLTFGPGITAGAREPFSTNYPALRMESTTNNVTLSIRRGTNTIAGDFASLIASNITASAGLFATNSSYIPTNAAPMNFVTNDYVLGTRYTNDLAGGFGVPRRAAVTASLSLTAAVAGTAVVTLYIEQGGGITNKATVSAGPLAGMVTTEQLYLNVSPSAVFRFVDETSGAGASVAIVSGTCSWFGF